MKDHEKPTEQLIDQLNILRKHNAELEALVKEQRSVSAALSQSEATFRQLTEKAVVGAYLIHDNVFVYVNPRMAEIFGYRVDEIQGRKGPKDLVSQHDWPQVKDHLSVHDSMAAEGAKSRFRGKRKDASVVHVEVHGSRIEEDGPPMIMGTLLDITDRVQARYDREQELRTFQGLYELAVAMTAERGLNENLAQIVETSRSLLNADKSFLALRDEVKNELYMHTISGIVTEEFKELRIPWGVGLGGKVAESGQLLVVQDYFAEFGPMFHDIARAEGLLSGVAVPVQVGGKNVGVLFIFNRAKTPFSQQDLETLSMLGNLAAVEITRKRALKQMEESEHRFRQLYEESKQREEMYQSLLNSSSDSIVIYDMDGKTQYVNPWFTRTFGWTLEELKDKQISFVPDSEYEATQAEIDKIVGFGTPCAAFETSRYTKDGQTLAISISASRFHDHEGKPAGVVSILRDITDRTRAEAALRRSEEKFRELYAESERRKQQYRTLLDASPDPIVVYDMQGILSYVNPAFSAVFGWNFEELEGKKTDFVPEENWPETHDMIEKVKRGRSFRDQETRRYTKEGKVIDVSISGAAFRDVEGNPSGSVVHLRDITHRKQAEANLAAELAKFQGLYDLALAMTAERDLEQNLTLIVGKSREILGSDTAFIALQDESTNELYMHTLSGVTTDELKRLRIPTGVGLGGKVAETARLHVVEDYFEEVGPALHPVVRAEGIVSGIAVPVQIGRTNVGVLYVFNRTKTQFSKADRDTLSLVGNLAAVEITRKRAEQRLREREESYKTLYEEATRREELYVSLLNSSADAVVIYDIEGRAQYVSPSFTRIFGWTMEEVEGKRIPFVPDAQMKPSMDKVYNVIREGTSFSGFETERLTKDGRILDISISGSRYHDHEGVPAGILVTLRDITDRKRSEAALRESEERFRTLAEVAPIGLVVIGADEETEYINPTFTELFGYVRQDIPDLHTWFRSAYSSVRSRKKAEEIWRADKAEIKTAHGFGTEADPKVFKIRCKDGGSKITSFRAVILADERVIATFLDVTAEMEAQQEIIRAKNEWERTFNSVSDLIIILDTQQRMLRANRAVFDRLGLDRELAPGVDVAELADSGRSIAALCPDTGRLDEGKDHSVEVFDEQLGGVFDLRVSPLLDDTGSLVGSVNVARDITAFKSMERARRLAVHHLSHELKTPVAVIKGSIKDLADASLSPASRERRVERIRRNLKRLSEIQEIVQEIVTPRPYEPMPFPLVPTLHELLEEIRTQSSHRAVTVVVEAEPIQTDLIDPKVFHDAVNTLVKNAIENTPDQGHIVVRLEEVAQGVLLQVQDTGVGIQWSDREFVFAAFHHTQDTEMYSTKQPFNFGAGGKGLELMRLKILSESGGFDISFDTKRCTFASDNLQRCPGRIDACPFVKDADGCGQTGGTTFSVLFRGTPSERADSDQGPVGVVPRS